MLQAGRKPGTGTEDQQSQVPVCTTPRRSTGILADGRWRMAGVRWRFSTTGTLVLSYCTVLLALTVVPRFQFPFHACRHCCPIHPPGWYFDLLEFYQQCYVCIYYCPMIAVIEFSQITNLPNACKLRTTPPISKMGTA